MAKKVQIRIDFESIPMREKSISITFRGFEINADALVAMFNVKPDSAVNKGERMWPRLERRAIKSYVIFSLNLPRDFQLCNMLPTLFEYMGGAEHIYNVKTQVFPEFLEIDFDLPTSKNHEQSQDGFLSETAIKDVTKLKASLSFSFS